MDECAQICSGPVHRRRLPAILFLLATILVPHRMNGVTDSYEYFMRGRKWFFGTLLLLLPIDIADTFLKGNAWGCARCI